MTQAQVDGCEAVLAATLGLPVAYQAYLLATTLHETARTMQPIAERGARGYFERYEPVTVIGRQLGNTQPGDGWAYRGRGYVQITGRANYARAGGFLKVDLVGFPDRALEPDIAAWILVSGCVKGWFTGRRLSDYLDGPQSDYVGARRVVNGTDRAVQIAAYAATFAEALA
ncbi:carboxypeptidase [Haematobacter massiliensis]|uniref:carboxypeptidase n=1 Tax=Haematobacter massiliensis TaxID=195105 RepID=UPI0023F52309|nr:carboxypeptidase [Haematobacter massiliensis]